MPTPAPEPVETVDLSTAAAMLVCLHADPELAQSYRGALSIWELLTGLRGDTALGYAISIAAGRTTAAVCPF